MGVLPFVKARTTIVIYDKADFPVDVMEVEATVSASHKRHAQVSRHPVARGEALTDNVRPDPDGLTLECFWGNRAGDIVLFGARYATGKFTEAENAYDKLNDIFRNAFRLTIKMRLWTYENMVIEDIGTLETVDDGASMRTTVTFTELKTVSLKIAKARVRVPKLGPKVSSGLKGLKTATAPVKAAASAATSTAISTTPMRTWTLAKR